MRKMRINPFIILILITFFTACSSQKRSEMKNSPVYSITRTDRQIVPDADWNKPEWQIIKAIEVNNKMGEKPLFTPAVQAKMMYDDDFLYVIFHVNDRYVRCVVTDINGPVYEEPAVEFFFSPDPRNPDRYFNLEINCGGTPLMHFNDFSSKANRPLDTVDIQKVEIAHSLPRIVDPEIKVPVDWTIEYRIPLDMLEKYSVIQRPEKGVEWRANFYKIAEKGTNIHFLTWSVVDNPVPDFHLPTFFGTIEFE